MRLTKIITLIIFIFVFTFASQKVKAVYLSSDFNQDGRVDNTDLQILIGSYKNPYTIFDFSLLVRQFGQTSTPNNPPTGSSLLISPSRLSSLPDSGEAWDTMRQTAYGSWGTADLTNQDNTHAIKTLAGALTYAKNKDPDLASRVRDGILQAKRSLDQDSEWQTTNGVLAAGRQIGAYVIAADVINLKAFDSAASQEFSTWLNSIRTTNIGTHGRWKNITYTCENTANNWGTFACASRLAASLYLGDNTDIARSVAVIRTYLGDRGQYPADAPGVNGYFQNTSSFESSWACEASTWTAINPVCSRSGVNISGALVEDASRGGPCCSLQGAGLSYSWEALQGLYLSAELIRQKGDYGDPFTWSDQALLRALRFVESSGWNITTPSTSVPWLANQRYGTDFPTSPSPGGRIMAWGDWLYQ